MWKVGVLLDPVINTVTDPFVPVGGLGNVTTFMGLANYLIWQSFRELRMRIGMTVKVVTRGSRGMS